MNTSLLYLHQNVNEWDTGAKFKYCFKYLLLKHAFKGIGQRLFIDEG